MSDRQKMSEVRISGAEEWELLRKVYAETYPVRTLLNECDALAAELASEKQQLDNALSFYPARIRDLEARIDHLRTVANTSGVRSEDMASAIYRVLSSSPMETGAKDE